MSSNKSVSSKNTSIIQKVTNASSKLSKKVNSTSILGAIFIGSLSILVMPSVTFSATLIETGNKKEMPCKMKKDMSGLEMPCEWDVSTLDMKVGTLKINNYIAGKGI